MKIAFAAAAIAATAICAAAVPAAAQNYNASIGYTQSDSDTGNLGAVTGRLGWKSSTPIGVEAEASFGTDHADVSPGVTAKLQSQIAGYVTATLPVSSSFDIIGRIGYGTQRVKFDPSGATASEDSLNYGVGAQWNFAGPNAVRADYTRYDFQGSGLGEADTYSLSYVRKF
jgi:outer membrane immunogenic protein